MSTSRFFTAKVKEKFAQFFDKSVIVKIGISSRFVKRKPKKISAYHYVLGFLAMCGKGKNTFEE